MKDLENLQILIVPDVHGRIFWKKPVTEVLENTDKKIVFLGDYVDPYGYEGITSKMSIDVFKEIIELKKKYNDRIVLLIGNHDMAYIGETGSGGRYDRWRADEIKALFMDNWDMFDFFYKEVVAGKTYLFSHAGVNPEWIKYRGKFLGLPEGEEPTLDFILNYDWKLNLFKDQMRLVAYLDDVSCWRWGSEPASSIVWCDVREHLFEQKHLSGCIQVFGHTQQEDEPVRMNDELYCLDVRRAFILDKDGVIRELTGKELENNGQKVIDAEKKYLDKASGFFF